MKVTTQRIFQHLVFVMCLTLSAVGSLQAAMKSGSGCSTVQQCVTDARSAIQARDFTKALASLDNAVELSAGDQASLATVYEAYALAYDAKGDDISAMAYIERSRLFSSSKNPAVESTYKRLLTAHPSMSAADMQKKLAMDQQILLAERVSEESAPPETTRDEGTQSAEGVEPEDTDGSEHTVEMGKTRGLGLEVASSDTNDNYRPKPGGHSAHSSSSANRSHSAAHSGASKRRNTKESPSSSHSPVKHATRAAKHPSQTRHTAHHHTHTALDLEDLPSLQLHINFEYNSAVLAPDGMAQADELGKELTRLSSEDPTSRFILLGHTDVYGSEGYNLDLSRDRANVVKNYLIEHFPKLLGSLRAEGMGKKKPLFDDADEGSQKFNRRVEVKIR